MRFKNKIKLKDNTGKHCNYQWKRFYPFVLSIDGMIGREYLAALAQLSRIMEEKIDELISHLRGWINGQIANAVEISYSNTIRRSRLPSPLQEKDPDWKPESGIKLAH